ncbi:MAG: signal peptidase I [Clostridiales bacterium]|nr:signal peptidase I [Clostridiales bacterium]
MTNSILNLYSEAGEGGSFFSMVMMIAAMAGLWKMFEKAGEPGWMALIPIYNIYKLCQISIGNGWLFLLALAGGIPVLGWIAMFVLIYLLAVNTAKAFGKSNIWALGLFFLAPVFYCLLGFGDADYFGPQGIGDSRPDETREANIVNFDVFNDNEINEEEAETIDFDVTKSDEDE